MVKWILSIVAPFKNGKIDNILSCFLKNDFEGKKGGMKNSKIEREDEELT